LANNRNHLTKEYQMKTLTLSLFALVTATFFSADAMAWRREYVLCESYNYQFNQCFVRGYIRDAQLLVQRSSSPCIYGSSWGVNGNSIWVSNGCRAQFEVATSWR
jgi:hypothetical protein